MASAASPRNEFSVYQFFRKGNYECVRSRVGAEEAMKAFKHYTTSVAARIGLVDRVIVTDGGDFINLEWVWKKGITFPTKEALEDAKR